VGDEIASTSGNPVIITTIKGDASERDVYNLTINEDHSYAVGELGVWSHNSRTRSRYSGPLGRDGTGRIHQNKEFSTCHCLRGMDLIDSISELEASIIKRTGELRPGKGLGGHIERLGRERKVLRCLKKKANTSR